MRNRPFFLCFYAGFLLVELCVYTVVLSFLLLCMTMVTRWLVAARTFVTRQDMAFEITAARSMLMSDIVQASCCIADWSCVKQNNGKQSWTWYLLNGDLVTWELRNSCLRRQIRYKVSKRPRAVWVNNRLQRCSTHKKTNIVARGIDAFSLRLHKRSNLVVGVKFYMHGQKKIVQFCALRAFVK